jgi:GH24 family phage-related lysozyme (muramidase)
MLAGGLSLSGLGVRPLTRAMPDSVTDVFIDFTTPLEGRVSYLYLDGVGLVTVGLGCMLESVGSALPLPFVHRDDMATPATQTEIRQAFSTVMARQDIRGRHTLFEPLTDIRLTNRGIDDLALQKLAEYERTLTGQAAFADLDQWPADAQLGLLSLTWAKGPGYTGWPNFVAACEAKDWVRAARECQLAHPVGTQVHRNAANWALFRDAAYVALNSLDTTTLYYQLQGTRPTVRLGSTGPDVTALQERLVALGYLESITTVFDADTDAAVRAFQQDNALDADGVCGGVSWAALGTCVPKGTPL